MSSRFFRRSRAALAGLVLCGGATTGVLAAPGGAAYAGDLPVYSIQSTSSGLYLDVSGASKAPGATVIQWPADGGWNQDWTLPADGSTGRIKNINSRMCLTTDGVAGDQLYQEPCTQGLARYQRWNVYSAAPGVDITNVHFNLVVDVYNNGTTEGTPIDAWPYNGHPNQWFQETSPTD